MPNATEWHNEFKRKYQIYFSIVNVGLYLYMASVASLCNLTVRTTRPVHNSRV